METEERPSFPLGKALLLAASPLLHRAVKRLRHKPEDRKVEEEALLFHLQTVTNGLCQSGAWQRSEIRVEQREANSSFVLTLSVKIQPLPLAAWEDGRYHLMVTSGGSLIIHTEYALERLADETKPIEVGIDDMVAPVVEPLAETHLTEEIKQLRLAAQQVCETADRLLAKVQQEPRNEKSENPCARHYE